MQALTPSTRQTAIAVLLFIADSQEFLLINFKNMRNNKE